MKKRMDRDFEEFQKYLKAKYSLFPVPESQIREIFDWAYAAGEQAGEQQAWREMKDSHDEFKVS